CYGVISATTTTKQARAYIAFKLCTLSPSVFHPLISALKNNVLSEVSVYTSIGRRRRRRKITARTAAKVDCPAPPTPPTPPLLTVAP
ncbi:unnamed protein product, partial [Ixodes pacificus]